MKHLSSSLLTILIAFLPTIAYGYVIGEGVTPFVIVLLAGFALLAFAFIASMARRIRVASMLSLATFILLPFFAAYFYPVTGTPFLALLGWLVIAVLLANVILPFKRILYFIGGIAIAIIIFPFVKGTSIHTIIPSLIFFLTVSALIGMDSFRHARDEDSISTKELQLYQSEERFRKLFAATFDAILILDNLTISDVNDEFETMFGYALSEALGCSVLDFIAPDFRDTVKEKLVTHYGKPFEALGMTRAGTPFFIELLSRIRLYRGREIEVLSIRDISEKKKTEKELVRSEENFRNLVQEIPDIVYRLDDEGNFTFVNDSIKELGYKPEELIGKHFSEILHPADIETVSRNPVLSKYRGKKTGFAAAPKLFDERRTGHRKTKNLEVRLITKDWKDVVESNVMEDLGKKIFCGEVTSSGVYDTVESKKRGGYLGTIGVIKDVTMRKVQEFIVQDSKETIERFTEEIPDIIYRIDNDGNFTFVSESIRYLGYDPKALIGKHFSAVLHPDSIEEVSSATVLPGYEGKSASGANAPKLFDERRTGTRKTRNLEVWLVKNNEIGVKKNFVKMFGKITAWGELNVLSSETPADAGDDHQGTVGIIRNITERKKTEDALKKYTEFIEQSLYEKQKNIEKAQLLQRNLNTETLPTMKNINSLVYYMPSEDLGGDFFDIRKIGNKLIIVLADCIGHGIGASMHATLLKAVSDRHFDYLEADMPDEYLSCINIDLIKYSYQDRFSTMFACIIDSATGTITYANANAELPYVVREEEVVGLPRVKGFHLGFDADIEFEKKTYNLQLGEVFVLYSDAIIEVLIEQRKILGHENVKNMLKNFGAGLVNDLGYILEALEKIKGSFPLDDDLTLILVENTGVLDEGYIARTVGELDKSRDALRSQLQYLTYAEEDVLSITTIYEEMYKNAVVHGNKNNPDKSVSVDFHVDCEEVIISVEDEGDGFDYTNVPDPTDYNRLLELLESGREEELSHGRGIWLARQYMDDVIFNDKGNRVTLKKKRSTVEAIFSYYQ